MVFFGNLSDSVDSLLNGGYKALGAISVTSKSRTNGGVALNFDAKKKNGKDNVTGGFKFCQVFNKDDLKVGVVGSITENGTAKDDITIDGLAEGFRASVGAVLLQNPEKDTEAKKDEAEEDKTTRNEVHGKLTYSHAKSNVGANLKVVKKHLNPVKVSLDLATEVTKNVAVGVSVSAPIKQGKEEEVKAKIKTCDTDFTVRLSANDVSVVGQLTDCGNKASCGIVHNVDSRLTVGAEFTSKGIQFPWCFKHAKDGSVEVVENDEPSKEQKWGLTLGFAYNTDSNATLKGKINHKGVATASYDFEVKENLRANLVCESQVSQFGQGTKLGLALTYNN